MMNPFAQLGRLTINMLDTFGGLALMLSDTIKFGFRKPFRLQLIIKQMEFIGVNSVIIVMLTGFFTGMVLAYQCYNALYTFAMEYMTGGIVALALARELAPVLASIMVVARCGSAITAEIGSMNVTEQVDALKALAIEPVQYLVVPRVIAGTIMMPMLNLVAVFTGCLGGWLVGVKFLGINNTLYMDTMIQFMGLSDLINGMIKAFFFGIILTVVGCYKGLHARGGALGVGSATTGSVVLSCILILLFDYILTAIMF